MRAEFGQGLVRVDQLPRLHLLDALAERFMKLLAFLIVAVVAAVSQHFVERHEFHDFTLRQVGGLVQHEPAVVNVSLEPLRRTRVYS